MKVVTRTKALEYRVFIASDETEFHNEADCTRHENFISNNQLAWVVVDYHRKYDANTFVAVFSTEEKANEWVAARNKYISTPERLKVLGHFMDSYLTPKG